MMAKAQKAAEQAEMSCFFPFRGEFGGVCFHFFCLVFFVFICLFSLFFLYFFGFWVFGCLWVFEIFAVVSSSAD